MKGVAIKNMLFILYTDQGFSLLTRGRSKMHLSVLVG